jgi:hypothetical protein
MADRQRRRYRTKGLCRKISNRSSYICRVRLPISTERRAFLNARTELGRFEHFMFAGIAGLGADGRRHSVLCPR